ncbi:hypothetical protein [Marinobacterium sp. BA1]|uniref:hypothetical protein n=1 Tax=Marinobacterium sp. BA1 TaxID=3138931 RepID=UPI0034E88543
MKPRKYASGSSLVEYLVIASVLAGLFFGLPAIRNMLEQHHDQAVETLSIPN